ncbi:cyclase family protein [Cupriavidus metallidurans]|uniref:cyclase family protein n=1 Tax=Cupriavidus metallidurans TaxID=119219 RepID=UPI001BFC04B3|nr:cyclase family protein [Cupriavidus metallidurans]QWC90667.1 cyclase family protein [Cupriavidus metallidurans]
MTTSRWKQRPAASNWGDFGPDDQLGSLNYITPDVVRKAVREVRTGQSLCLSLPLDYPGGNVLNPRRHPPRLRPTERDGRLVYNLPLSASAHEHTDVLCDDSVLLHTQYSTQWDSFAHVGHRFDVQGDGNPVAVYYNGFRAGVDVVGPGDPEGRPMGAHRLGIETFAVKAIQSRGVLVDLLASCGRERVYVGYDHLMRAMDAARVEVEPGDILCLYTGFADMLLEMERQPDPHLLERSCAVLDGRDARLQQWIVDQRIAALCADNYAVEGIPATAASMPCARLPLHELCLFRYGIPLGELWYLAELAAALKAEGRTRFLLTAPPLRLPGAVGSPVTPVATI